MRLLADENFPIVAVEALRARGHDVAWVREDAPSVSDQKVLQRSIDESRILITFDKDFGELTFRIGIPAPYAIVLFRIPPYSPDHVAQTAVTVLESRDDWVGHFAVIEETKLRVIPLPNARES